MRPESRRAGTQRSGGAHRGLSCELHDGGGGEGSLDGAIEIRRREWETIEAGFLCSFSVVALEKK